MKEEINQHQNLFIINKILFRKLISNRNKKDKVKMNKPEYLGMSILDISKTLYMNFSMITLNQNIKTK